jgi:hypothetical protein
MELGDILALMKYGEDWRLNRRVFHQEFNSHTFENFLGIQVKYAQ